MWLALLLFVPCSFAAFVDLFLHAGLLLGFILHLLARWFSALRAILPGGSVSRGLQHILFCLNLPMVSLKCQTLSMVVVGKHFPHFCLL